MTFSSVQSGLSFGSGSVVNTSRAAPPIRFACSASIIAGSSTIAPRAMLRIHAVGFIREMTSREIAPRVAGVSGAAMAR